MHSDIVVEKLAVRESKECVANCNEAVVNNHFYIYEEVVGLARWVDVVDPD